MRLQSQWLQSIRASSKHVFRITTNNKESHMSYLLLLARSLSGPEGLRDLAPVGDGDGRGGAEVEYNSIVCIVCVVA